MEISQAAFALIIAEEVTSEGHYEKRLRRPEWPGEQSGVTGGIGYDFGYHTRDEIAADWSGLLPAEMIAALQRACCVHGPDARPLAKELCAVVDIPWAAAIKVFRDIDIPKWTAICRQHLPNFNELAPDCRGALVSLTYNRGASFQTKGDRYQEMRSIYEHMQAHDFHLIPSEIRSMKRLWPNSAGLRNRRDHEADLFERGLNPAS
jgi:hypothetical protein